MLAMIRLAGQLCRGRMNAHASHQQLNIYVALEGECRDSSEGFSSQQAIAFTREYVGFPLIKPGSSEFIASFSSNPTRLLEVTFDD